MIVDEAHYETRTKRESDMRHHVLRVRVFTCVQKDAD